MRKLCLALFMVIIALWFSRQIVEAGTCKFLLERDWKAEQQELFAQVDLRPDDLITKNNCFKVKDLLPPSVLAWVQKGAWELKIGKFDWDCRPDDEWLKQSLLNEGIYSLGGHKEIVETANGEAPTFVNGYPYPEIDLTNDMDVGVKVMHNSYLGQYRVGAIYNHNKSSSIGKNGYERDISGRWIRYYYWARPDGEQSNPKRYLYLDLISVSSPFDIAGMTTLTYRMIDGKPDKVLTYVPSIRRPKRSSGANRSDPFLGLDFTSDDGNGWAGNNSSMKWTFIEERTILHPMAPALANGPAQFRKKPDGPWVSPPDEEAIYPACLTEGWKRQTDSLAAWAPTNLVWIPRTYWVIKSEPLDPAYNSGTQFFYVDRNTQTVNYRVIHDKDGNYWKTLLISWQPASWGDQDSGGERISFGSVIFYVSVDDRTDHASWCQSSGTIRGFHGEKGFNDPSIRPTLFTPSSIKTLSK